ncbi:MAG: peptide ABC transporter ATP-binding protein, partial [Mesorhizobium sp.]
AGTLPDLRRRPSGCVFQPRCDRADAQCLTTPSSAILGGSHIAHCWHADIPLRAMNA